jgi:hypothetical protein
MQPSDANFVEVGENASVITPFVDGKVDAIFTGGAGGPLLLANPKNPGHVILDSTLDKPWSQNYCCLLITTRDWYDAHPVAAKRATRGRSRDRRSEEGPPRRGESGDRQGHVQGLARDHRADHLRRDQGRVVRLARVRP